VLICSGTPSPAQLQLRSAFEALISIEYILKEDTERRAFAYLAAWAHTEIAKLRMLSAG
jgi:hypothetical protein